MDANQKAVVLVSGGVDSTTLAYYMRQLGYDIHMLSVFYGQRHKRELDAVCAIAHYMGLAERHTILDLGNLRGLLPSALTGVGTVPHGHYTAPSMAQTVVPGRNLILLAVAAGYAQGLGAKVVAYAAHSGDHAIYPDCRPEFYAAANQATQLGYGVELLAPFVQFTKKDIVAAGTRMGVPYELTWSCYEGGDMHCGKCGTCVERREAFDLLKLPDPTAYAPHKARS